MSVSTHFEKFLAEHNQYIKKLTNELGLYDENITVHFVRSVFHTLRDRLTLQQSFHVLAHLPAFLKLYYIEGWKYKTQASRIDTSSEFYKIAGERFREISGNSIHPKKTIAECTLVVLASLREFLDEGTIRHIYAELPASLHQLFEFPVEK